ncbi:MAG TPA: hypothetical protein VK204_19610 [Nocardioidaceae bacterium]|nr:hypothetical protein [Nocardioidaceae bacterium]
MKLWKALGLAGLAGVAATGVIIARNERQRAQLTPEEIRERLHQRLDDAQPELAPPEHPEAHEAAGRPGCLRAWRGRRTAE